MLCLCIVFTDKGKKCCLKRTWVVKVQKFRRKSILTKELIYFSPATYTCSWFCWTCARSTFNQEGLKSWFNLASLRPDIRTQISSPFLIIQLCWWFDWITVQSFKDNFSINFRYAKIFKQSDKQLWIFNHTH